MDNLWTPWRMPYLRGFSSDDPQPCIFCAKASAADEVAEHILARGERCFITLNLFPYNNGHLLVAPYQHIGQLEALDIETLTELMSLTQRALRVLQAAYSPHAFNIGINQGAAAGAGIAGHLHQHIVPRWQGDTNYMTIVGQTRVIPEWIDDTFNRLKACWAELYPET